MHSMARVPFTEIVLQEGLETIREDALSQCAFREIWLPRSLQQIEKSTFWEDSHLKIIHYAGTEEEWKQVKIGEENPSLEKATVLFNESAPPIASFADVSSDAWYADSVEYASFHRLMGGTGENIFEPESPMTRSMLVTVLWRYEKSPMGYINHFDDVPEGQWFTPAVAWAAEEGIVNGTGGNCFGPDGKITREQLATILYRYAEKKGLNISNKANLDLFPDAAQVSQDWALRPMQWAVGAKLIGGSDGYLLPQGNATRAQVATILMRFMEKTSKS